MHTYECILAIVLLAGPKDQPTATDLDDWLYAMRPTVLAMALEEEILDPRELSFFLAPGGDATGDLTTLRCRMADFADAPCLAECKRLPDRKAINEYLAFNRAYRNDLTTRLSIARIHAEELRNALADTDKLHSVWDAVRDAKCDYYYVTVRRQALRLLRELVGPEAFYSGHLPPHVPLWHFASSKN